MSGPDGDLLATDKAYANAMERANDVFLAALRGERVSPRESRWGGATISTWQRREGTKYTEEAKRLSEILARKAHVESLRTLGRDPCVRCGVRADQHREFGCAQFGRAG